MPPAQYITSLRDVRLHYAYMESVEFYGTSSWISTNPVAREPPPRANTCSSTAYIGILEIGLTDKHSITLF